MTDLDALTGRLEQLLGEVERFDEAHRTIVFELLDGIDALHRAAIEALGRAVDETVLQDARVSHPAVAWLLHAYGVSVDEAVAAEAALAEVRPYLESHGGDVEVVDANDGIVRVRLQGSCSGCTSSAATLAGGVEEALRAGMPGFVRLEVEEDIAPPHPPPAAMPVATPVALISKPV